MSSVTSNSCPRGFLMAHTAPANTNRKPFCSSIWLIPFNGVSSIFGTPGWSPSKAAIMSLWPDSWIFECFETSLSRNLNAVNVASA